MGKWACQCGQPMNDHKSTDPNEFLVYSEIRYADWHPSW